MTTRLNEAYFNWLVSQIEIPNGKSYTYLFERMHSLEFVWTVPHDDNRIQDALDLRVEFKYESNLRGEIKTPVSILEVLIALSRRVAFIGGGWEHAWAWKLIKNLRLTRMWDGNLTERKVNRIEDILYALVWRTYHEDGIGGFFPLMHPEEDQTKLEIWAQMNLYIMERKSSSLS